MIVYKLDVDDKDIDTEDGYELYFNNPYELGVALETAVRNGYKNIWIKEAKPEEKLEYCKIFQEQNPFYHENNM